MSDVPVNPVIYHITHFNNLAGILRDGGLYCDALRKQQNIANTNIGHQHIKQRRLLRKVDAGAHGMLGDYVPFYFCYRSVMLLSVSSGHADYGGGEDEIVHLVSSAKTAIALGQPWAFSDRHAELQHALYYDDLRHLDEVTWSAMPKTYWQDCKELRQAEFLVHQFFAWKAVELIGVKSPGMKARVEATLRSAGSRVQVESKPGWYYK